MRKDFVNYLLLWASLSIYACSNPPSTSPKEVLFSGYETKVTTSAGSFENLKNRTTLAPPFNLAEIEGLTDLEVIILSESLNAGKSIKVIPVGLLRIEGDSSNLDYVIAVPSDAALNNLGIKSFGDLAVNNPVSKQIIESWCQDYSSNIERKSTRWLSEQSAIEIISQRSHLLK